MGLFGSGKKKKQEEKVNFSAYEVQNAVDGMPDLPEFPSASEDGDLPEFPTYESSVSDIKKGVGTDEEFNVPVRESRLGGKRMAASSYDIPTFSDTEEGLLKNNSLRYKKPIYVKINTYKEAIDKLSELKSKIEDSEEVLRALEDIKLKEDEKFNEWKRDLQNIKEKLIFIDKELFEV